MAKNYYETLGVAPSARSSEIKAAYRRLVLKHHPDRSKDPAATQIFRGIAEAFEVLGDPQSRRKYDESLAAEVRRRQEILDRERQEQERARQTYQRTAESTSRVGTSAPQATKPKASPLEVSEMVRRLTILFGRQKFAECELLARQIIQVDATRAMPYAVLGDIARTRGKLDDAARMYSLALQMEPGNGTFLKRYEEILDRSQVVEGRGHRVGIEPQEKRVFAMLAIVVVTLLCSIYVVLSPEKPILMQVNPISSWTVGIVVMLFLCGVSAGASLSISNLIDRVDSYSTRRVSSTVLYGVVAILSFPIALLAYGFLATIQRAFSVTTTRLMTVVACITFCIGMASAVPLGGLCFLQTLCWGGNLVYLGSIAGWAVADNLRA